MELTQKQIQLVINAQREVINQPDRFDTGTINSKSTFVRELIAENDPELARLYWHWVCVPQNQEYGQTFKHPNIITNQVLIDEIDRSALFADWHNNT